MAATIRKTLFKDLILDEENAEIVDVKEIDNMFIEDADM